jgi:DNA mismatch endonuclease Vsr
MCYASAARRKSAQSNFWMRFAVAHWYSECVTTRGMDNLTRAQRSATMARVRSRNTKPELAVRRLVHALGYRYRLHGANLPGKPDLVFAKRCKVIFVLTFETWN